MKRLLIALGLFSIVGSAMAQTTSAVSFTVNAYFVVAFDAGTIDWLGAAAITDGGFGTAGPYPSNTRGYTVTANTVAFTVTETLTTSPGLPAGSTGTWTFAITPSATFIGAAPGGSSTTGVTLTKTGSAGFLGEGSGSAGLVTLSIVGV